ncbi:MAG TPA: IclR family transcriptional regulator [Thermodesulfobacteriota bacterium]
MVFNMLNTTRRRERLAPVSGKRRLRGRPGVRRQTAGRGYGRLIDLLDILTLEEAGLTGSDISRRLSLPRSTVSVLLRYLVDRGVVALDPQTRRYCAGPVLVQLAHRIVGGLQLVRVARPHLEALSALTGEDSYLGIRTGTEFIYVDRVEGSQSIGLNLRLGLPRYLHSTAVGKLLLAFGPPGLLDEVIAERGLPAMTPATITDRARLVRELERIRQQGYSVSEEENVEGVYGLAAPIRNHAGEVIGAVHISALRARARERRDVLVERMCDAARRISEALGAR